MRWVRRSRLTLTLLTLLVLVSGWFGTLSNAMQTHVELAASTNLANLGSGHFGTLITSAFFGMGSSPWWWLVVGASLLLAEWEWGAKRMLLLLVAGHAGTTLVLAGGLEVGEHLHLVPETTMHATDVGFSYALMALVGALTLRWSRRSMQTPWAMGWLGFLGWNLLTEHTFTDVGHLLAYGVGFVLSALLLSRLDRGQRPAVELLHSGEGQLVHPPNGLGELVASQPIASEAA